MARRLHADVCPGCGRSDPGHNPAHCQVSPELAGAADLEYQTRLDAERVTLQFRDSIRPEKPQHAVEDLPLFGGERQGGLF